MPAYAHKHVFPTCVRVRRQCLSVCLSVWRFVSVGVHLIVELAENLIRRYNGRVQILVGGMANWKDGYASRCVSNRRCSLLLPLLARGLFTLFSVRGRGRHVSTYTGSVVQEGQIWRGRERYTIRLSLQDRERQILGSSTRGSFTSTTLISFSSCTNVFFSK